MNNFRYLVVLVFLSYFLSAQAYTTQISNIAFRNFWHPIYNGERLNYCSLDGKECGKSVANRYCQILGYDHVSQYAIAHNIGLTHFIDSRARCKGWTCNGFMTIACATELAPKIPKPYHYREKKFVVPRYDNYRVDWCYELKHGCGLSAANSFCSRMGFMQAKRFVKENQVGATKTIGSQELCFGTQCKAFQQIVCYR